MSSPGREKKFTVRERVVFEYVWHVRAKSSEEASEMIDSIGDGDVVDHAEVERDVIEVRRGWILPRG